MLIYGFNEACSNIASSYLKVGDESMSTIRFCTMSKGYLTHLSYIFRKPEPLGTEFETVACSVTEDFIFLGIQRGEEGMKSIWFHLELGNTATCAKILMERTKMDGEEGLERINGGFTPV